MIKLVRELRSELKNEDRMNNIKWAIKRHADHELFENYYKLAIHESVESIKGRLNTEKAYKFLCDAKDYMKKYIPEDTN